jgi:hypothetical protein
VQRVWRQWHLPAREAEEPVQRVRRQPHRSARTELGRGHCLVPVVSLALLPDVLALRGLTRPHQPTEGVWHVHDENSLRVTAVQAGAGLGAAADYRHSAMLPRGMTAAIDQRVAV